MDTEEIERFVESHPPVPAPWSLSPGATLGGVWRIAAPIGRGGSSEVYRAVHRELRTEAAAKLLLPDAGDAAKARFVREIRFLAENTHPAFPRFLGTGETGGRPYMLMELLEPCDPPSTDAGVAELVTAVARGLRVLHSEGLAHRDIKPRNIMRRGDGSPVIIDFGLAREFRNASSAPDAASISVVDGRLAGLGTPRYSAPEQFSLGDVSPACDIHALGVLANDCFKGKPPRAWTRIIRRAASSIPEQRYPDAESFIKAVKRRHLPRTAAACIAAAFAAAAAAAFFRESAPGAAPVPSGAPPAAAAQAPDSQPPDAAAGILELAKEREEEARIMDMY